VKMRDIGVNFAMRPSLSRAELTSHRGPAPELRQSTRRDKTRRDKMSSGGGSANTKTGHHPGAAKNSGGGSTSSGASAGAGVSPGAGKGQGPGDAGGWPSTTGNPSGAGRSNNPPSK
jgi:hypothetical protein